MITKIRSRAVLVDDDFYPTYKLFSWHIEKGHGYVVRRVKKDGKNKKIYLHRLVANAQKGELVDHINQNKLDNRRKNLRITNRSTNALNSKTPSDNTSGQKGVSWNKRKKVWRAYITKDGKQIHLGNYKSRDLALVAYQGALRVLLST